MNKIKTGLVTATGLVIGAVTLRKLRERRSTPAEEAETPVEEVETAAEHLSAAAEHARSAAEMALEDAREDVDVEIPIEAPRGDEEESASEESRSRLRTVGRDLIRRE